MNQLRRFARRGIVHAGACVMMFWSGMALASTTGKVAGRVVDKNGDALPSANVVLMGTTLGAVTDLEGYYSIINIPPGRYEVQFRLVGYRPVTVREVSVTVNTTTKLDASLEEDAITTDAVVVTAKKPVVDVSLTSTIATVTDQDIKALPVQELQDIVSLQAGVVDGHFRGGREGEVQYQVNGVSVNNAYDNRSVIRIDRSLIQEVQVITGTFDAEYGQAMSGVVNTVLKSGGEEFAWNAEVIGGDFLYASGGKRGLSYEARPASMQNYQLSISGPTGLPQTFFLVNARRHYFDDYLYGQRKFLPTDIDSAVQQRVVFPTGDGKEVPMAYKREWSGLAKITNKSLSGIEISYQGLFNIIEERNIGGAFQWVFNPDGRKTQRTKSFVHGLDFTHTVTTSTFYTLNARQNYFDYTDWVYEDFYDARYDSAGRSVSIPYGPVMEVRNGVPVTTFYDHDVIISGVDLGRFRQKTNQFVFKAAVTSQVTRAHQLRFGAELHTGYLQFGSPGTMTYVDVGGVSQLVRYENFPPDYPGVQTFKPLAIAAYGHDLIEWNDLTIRAGLRMEYFDARTLLPGDLENPANNPELGPTADPVRTSKKISVAPRFGLSYPITESSSIFFSYGHFYQLPPLGTMLANSDYNRLYRIQAGTSDYGVMGNPDVKPEQTVHYEFGYKNAVTDYLGITLNVFYKDIRDLLGVEFISTYNDAQYSRLTNVDFGNVIGFTISLDQRRVGIVSSSLDYTWQMAQGNSSDPQETARLAEAGRDSRPRQVPLNWDQRHTLNLSFQLSEPEDYSVSTIVRFGSGLPYTPAIGSGFGSLIETNSARRPIGLIVDLRAEKSFSLAGMSMSVFGRVFNLFDATYFNGSVFTTTGSPDYSTTPATDRNRLLDPTRYYAPRRIEIGIAVNSSL